MRRSAGVSPPGYASLPGPSITDRDTCASGQRNPSDKGSGDFRCWQIYSRKPAKSHDCASDQLGPEVRAHTTNAILNDGSAPPATTIGTFFWVDPKEELAVVYIVAAPGEARGRIRMVRNMVLQAIAH
jgi:hypothetical protein